MSLWLACSCGKNLPKRQIFAKRQVIAWYFGRRLAQDFKKLTGGLRFDGKEKHVRQKSAESRHRAERCNSVSGSLQQPEYPRHWGAGIRSGRLEITPERRSI